MEAKTKKILLVSIASLVVFGVGYYFLFFKNRLTATSFEKPIEVEIKSYNESEVKDWNEYVDENSISDNIEAVMVWGDIYLFDPYTYWFENENEDYYDEQNEILVIGENTYSLTKDNVDFGYVNNEGNFVA